MESKAENPIQLLEGQDAPTLLQAFFELCQLKQLYRQGWLRRGVSRERCESVAEHSFGTAVLALWLAGAYYPELDTGKVIELALAHDFGEIYAGDIIPSQEVSAQEKHQREAASVRRVVDKLPGGERYRRLWEEYERGESAEARFVRQIDRLEMGLQAGLYALQGLVQPDEFIASARQALEDERLVELLEAVQRILVNRSERPASPEALR